MSVQIKTPNITGGTDREKLSQIQSYLYQMARQLQWAFETIDVGTNSAGGSGVSTANRTADKTGSVGGSAAKPEDTFSAIKTLIIKSADIVDAYYTQISKRLSGVYVEQSDFGTYTEQTDQKIQENSTAIQRNFTNIQSVTTNMADIESILVGVSAYINTGLLYDDDTGAPVYGIEVGQRTAVDGEEVFNKYARFTSSKLSFFDSNDNEVAYVSDYKLYISNVEITGSYRIGHLVDTVQADGSVVTKYVRGEM